MADKQAIMDEEIISWIQLVNTNNIGPITFFQLLQRFKDIETTITQIPNIARKKDFKLFPREKAEEILKRAHDSGIHVIIDVDDRYPQRLKNVNDRPPILFVKSNNLDILNQKKVLAFVGSRNCSINGRAITEALVRDVGDKDSQIITISGLARGIDTVCHKISIKNNIETIAVLAGGVDVVYPEENKELYEDIVENGGAIVSESLPGTKPQANLFPRRNRIIAGMSDGLVVVEAAMKSGSLVSARYALEYGRDLFAVPGFPLDARFRGSNYLIKNGAHIVESADDILSNLKDIDYRGENNSQTGSRNLFELMEQNNGDGGAKNLNDAVIINEEENDAVDEKNYDLSKKVLDMMGYNPVSIDQLARVVGVTTEELSASLLDLELNGKITHYDENSIMRVA